MKELIGFRHICETVFDRIPGHNFPSKLFLYLIAQCNIPEKNSLGKRSGPFKIRPCRNSSLAGNDPFFLMTRAMRGYKVPEPCMYSRSEAGSILSLRILPLSPTYRVPPSPIFIPGSRSGIRRGRKSAVVPCKAYRRHSFPFRELISYY